MNNFQLYCIFVFVTVAHCAPQIQTPTIEGGNFGAPGFGGGNNQSLPGCGGGMPGMEGGQLPTGQLPVGQSQEPGLNIQNQTFPGLTQIGGYQNQSNIEMPSVQGGQMPDIQGASGQVPGMNGGDINLQNQTFPGTTQIGGFQNQSNIQMPGGCGGGEGGQLPTGQLPVGQSQESGFNIQNQTFPGLTQIGGFQNQTNIQMPGGEGGEMPGANGQVPGANGQLPGAGGDGQLPGANGQLPGMSGGDMNIQNQTFPGVQQIGGFQNQTTIQLPGVSSRKNNGSKGKNAKGRKH